MSDDMTPVFSRLVGGASHAQTSPSWDDLQVTVGNGRPSPGPVDWVDKKRRIFAGLGPAGVLREFRALGVKTEGAMSLKGKVACHAMDRADDRPSAFLNCVDGIYHSKGEVTETLNLLDFALKYGSAKFGDWITAAKHYAVLAGVELDARRDKEGRIVEATYDYTDESGATVFRVIRYRLNNGDKDFRQRQPDGKGGWIYNLDGVTRVLYGLPAILADPSRHVFVVEGEKDADRLNAAFGSEGLPAVATTSAQGAKDTARWRDEAGYRETLRDRDVVVIPDNDKSGLEHARGICEVLHGIARSVKLVPLPEVGKKGDASDWLDQGHTLDELWTLVTDCPPFDPAAPPPEPTVADKDRDATAADLIAANEGTRWLWPQWIPVGVLTLLTAEPSTGKTRLGLDLTKRIALSKDSQQEWPDGTPINLDGRNPVVLWIPADSQHSELADAPDAFKFPPGAIVLNTTVGNLYGGTELDQDEQLKDLEARIKRVNPALVIIDTITNTSDLKSQDTSDAKRQYKPLQDIAKRTRCPIVCVTHTNIAGKTLGRRADEKTRVTIRLERPDPEAQPNRRKLSVALSRVSVYPSPLGVTMHDNGNDYDGTPPATPAEQATAPRIKPPTPAESRAIGWLVTRLQGGRVRVGVLRDECAAMQPCIATREFYKASEVLGVEETLDTLPGSSRQLKWWALPSTNPSMNPDA